MKQILCLAASLLAFNLAPVFGQNTLTLSSASVMVPGSGSDSKLTKFTLDFPGGTPAELVKAIEKAAGKPLNVIIPDEYARTGIPALKMGNVDVPQLFNAVVNTSYRYGQDRPGYSREVISSYGFETKDSPVTDSSIWYFFVYQAQPPKPPEKICRFYNLDPLLNRGFTVDDITTAIQTGWKMAGVTPLPELNYHKETKMLIAFGEPSKLESINNVLNTLPGSPTSYADMHGLYDSLGRMQGDIKKLQQKVDQLTKANPAPASSAEEKSGK